MPRPEYNSHDSSRSDESWLRQMRDNARAAMAALYSARRGRDGSYLDSRDDAVVALCFNKNYRDKDIVTPMLGTIGRRALVGDDFEQEAA